LRVATDINKLCKTRTKSGYTSLEDIEREAVVFITLLSRTPLNVVAYQRSHTGQGDSVHSGQGSRAIPDT
jgi:hypothetical protein